MNTTVVLWIALGILTVTNMTSYLLMRHDKRCAQTGARRVPESRLFLAAACFGGLGGVLAMRHFRHKTRHWHFRIFFPLLLMLQAVLLGVGVFLLL